MSDAFLHIERGDRLVSAFWSNGEVEDLTQAVLKYRAALACCDQDDPGALVSAQIALAEALSIQVRQGHIPKEHIDDGMTLAEAALDTALEASDIRDRAALTLAKLLIARRRAADSSYAGDVLRALETLRTITTSASRRREFLLECVAVTTTALVLQWDRTEDDMFLDQCNDTVDSALRILAGDQLPPFLILPLIQCRVRRGVTKHRIRDVDECITTLQLALHRSSPDDPRRCEYWDTLGFCFEKRWVVWGSPADLDSCITSYDTARTSVHDRHPRSAMTHGNFADSLYARFVSRSDIRDLDEATDVIRLVLERMDHADDTRDYYVNLLGRLLEEGYGQYGKLELLDESIQLHILNLRNAPPTRQSLYHTSLANAFTVRFSTHGRTSDLELAINHLREGLSKCPTDRHRCSTSRHLADALITRFNEQSNLSDIQEALSILQTSLAYADPSKRELGLNQSWLGWAFLCLFLAQRDSAHLFASIRAQEAALDLLPAEHVQRSLVHLRLGMALFQLSEQTEDLPKLYEAVTTFDRALQGLSDVHPQRGTVLLQLARAQLALKEVEGDVRVYQAIKTFQTLALDECCLVTDRFTGAITWARTAHTYRDLTNAIEGYRCAIELLPQMAWLGLEDDVRMRRLSKQTAGLSSDAAACAIESGQLELAVELLEQSRGILWNSSQTLRSDLGRLKDVEPELAHEMTEISTALQYRPSISRPVSDEEKESERRRQHRLASRWTSLVDKSRQIYGFEHILAPLTYKQLSHVARRGPVILLNVSDYRCDALIVPAADEAVHHVPLATLTHARVLQAVRLLRHALGVAKDKRGGQFLDTTLMTILRHLWVVAGGPIYISLQLFPGFSKSRRVWWCPVGAMALLPLHACGLFDGSQADMADLVVSSYTPTLSALLRPMESRTGPSSTTFDILVVCQANTPGHTPLLRAKDESDVLRQLFRSSGTFVDGSEATRHHIQELLATHTWFHICSHGTQRVDAPLECALQLSDGPLTLKHLTSSTLSGTEVAFLSACHSAHGDEGIPDESLHLAAGLIFAGFRGVIATQWAIADKDAPHVAREFYRYLLRSGGRPDPEEAADALHRAIQSLRKSLVPTFRWVPFVHVGI